MKHVTLKEVAIAVIALAVVVFAMAAFSFDTAAADPPPPGQESWWYEWNCTTCSWTHPYCAPPENHNEKYCEKKFCEFVGGQLECTVVDSDFFCCDTEPFP